MKQTPRFSIKGLKSGLGIALMAWLALSPDALAKPVKLEQRSLNGVPAQVAVIDLNDPQTHLAMLLANQAPLANSAQQQFGDENFSSMVQRSKASVVVNGTFFSKDAQKRVMGNMVSNGIFVKYSRWENFGTSFGLNANNQPDMFTIRSGDASRWEKHWFSITAGPRLLKDGVIKLAPDTEGFKDPHVLNSGARAALGYSRDGKTLYLVSFLSGLSLQREAEAMKALGAWQAMNLDGGASKGLAYKGRVLLAPGRRLTNAIAVYDSAAPATQQIKQSRSSFQIARLPNGELPFLTPDAPKPQPTPVPSTHSAAVILPRPSPSPTPKIQAAPTPQPDVMSHPQAMPALAAPKYFFWYLHTRDYVKAWAVLTEASRQSIVSEIQASLDNTPETGQKVRRALDSHDPGFAPAFWDSFRQTVDSEKWVQSFYVLQSVNEREGVVMTRPGQIPLVVRFEASKWCFGLAESFSEKL